MEEHKHTSMKDIILQRCEKNKNDCWIWNGSMSCNGYGKIDYKGKTISSHRASYVAFKGEIGKGLYVCHSCDVKHCVNPSHLWLGTCKDNIQDAKVKRRLPDQRGRKMSEDAKRKMSEAKIKNPVRYWKEKKRSEETKKKISETKKGATYVVNNQ